jgi:hypothetical protein
VLEHVFPPFLACCADAVMRSKRHVAIDDEDGVMATSNCCGHIELLFWR